MKPARLLSRINKTLLCAPAMAADTSKRLWDISDIVALLDMGFLNPMIQTEPLPFPHFS